MAKLLHVSASPRGEQSESLAVASAFVEVYRESHPGDVVEHWDLWDGALPAFGPVATAAKMAVIRGDEPTGEQVAVWREVVAAVERFTSADRLLFSVPMWNSGIPYVLKQFVDVVSQPGMVFGVDVETGYLPLLAGRGKRAAVVYTSSIWGPEVAPGFGADFQSTYFDNWLRWAGITDVTEIRHHPTLTGDVEDSRQTALATAREVAKTF
ncbi:NAD(P)H-dependent oxidoreductase [Actinosynnema sp. NPDC050436]|uniref:FMN-dependent NADH-azoreductase n=1 Tax=Actinosynnema sp. NPDC050436 TaxID=3155659 RepID=UPI003409AA6F